MAQNPQHRYFLEVINPAGTVPAIEYQGQPVNESEICMLFLEDAFPDQGKPQGLPTH
jgi:glutathione S-transferase